MKKFHVYSYKNPFEWEKGQQFFKGGGGFAGVKKWPQLGKTCEMWRKLMANILRNVEAKLVKNNSSFIP